MIYSSSQILITKGIKAIVRIKWIPTYEPFSTVAQSKWQIQALTTVTIILVSELMLGLI